MSSTSSIEWTDATWNPVRGCSRVSEGCRHCYAERVAARFRGDDDPFHGFAYSDKAGPHWTGKVELILSKLDEPLRWRKPRRIFVGSMSDLFHERLSDEAIAAVFGVMAACPQHTFQALTKRPERMQRWFEWARECSLNLEEQIGERPPSGHGEPTVCTLYYDSAIGGSPSARAFADRLVATRGCYWPLPNVWLGVSVEDQATADERIPLLLQTPAAIRFVSYEPALGPVDFAEYLGAVDVPHLDASGAVDFFDDAQWHEEDPIDWLIVGGESGPGARPFNIAWAYSAVAQCKAAGVPVFVKQLGAVPILWCSQCGHEVGRVLSGWTGACGPTHALLIAESQRILDRKGGDPSEWPEDLRVREFPEALGAA